MGNNWAKGRPEPNPNFALVFTTTTLLFCILLISGWIMPLYTWHAAEMLTDWRATTTEPHKISLVDGCWNMFKMLTVCRPFFFIVRLNMRNMIISECFLCFWPDMLETQSQDWEMGERARQILSDKERCFPLRPLFNLQKSIWGKFSGLQRILDWCHPASEIWKCRPSYSHSWVLLRLF